MTPWHLSQLLSHLLWPALVVCGAIVPGPCTFDRQSEWDCSLGKACPENFACAADGYCKSADIACTDDEERCEVPGKERVGLCVATEAMQTSKTHCGGCYARCPGAGVCEDGVCVGAPPEDACAPARGHHDCSLGDACVDDGDDNADVGICQDGGAGTRKLGADCSAGTDCEGGLCSEGACTRPCDFGCPPGTACDDDAIPGGLCAPTGEEVCP